MASYDRIIPRNVTWPWLHRFLHCDLFIILCLFFCQRHRNCQTTSTDTKRFEVFCNVVLQQQKFSSSIFKVNTAAFIWMQRNYLGFSFFPQNFALKSDSDEFRFIFGEKKTLFIFFNLGLAEILRANTWEAFSEAGLQIAHC